MYSLFPLGGPLQAGMGPPSGNTLYLCCCYDDCALAFHCSAAFGCAVAGIAKEVVLEAQATREHMIKHMALPTMFVVMIP